MKSLFTAIVIIGFIGIAVFGIFDMHVGMQNHDGGCTAAMAQGTDCPKQSSPLDYFAFHLDAFKNFLTATFSDIAVSLLILSLLAIGIALGTLLGILTPSKPAYYRLKGPDSFNPPSQHAFVRWLALHENSPAALNRAPV